VVVVGWSPSLSWVMEWMVLVVVVVGGGVVIGVWGGHWGSWLSGSMVIGGKVVVVGGSER
jgi:hypothetical protein